MPTCDHCGEQFGADDEWAEITPETFMYDGDEVTQENMGWRVHWTEMEQFVQYLRSEYDYDR